MNQPYANVVDRSERVAWTVDEVFPRGAALDFGRPFLPTSMFTGRSLAFLDPEERLKLNQILGNGYSYLFYFVEAYVIDMAMRHAQAELYGDHDTLRAMLRFAEEEVKHQEMFLRFGGMFEAGFGARCDVIESPQTLASMILSKAPMAVALTTLHLEIITQVHYVDCMKGSAEIDPLFKDLFKHHWLEEAQHVRLDTLELAKLRRLATPQQVATTIHDYFGILTGIGGILAQQASLDAESLERAIGRTLSEAEIKAVRAEQTRTYRRAFLASGLENPMFLAFLEEHFPEAMPQAAWAREVFA